MTLTEYVQPFESTYKEFSKEQKLDFLQSIFLNFLVEDAQDGTTFDCDVVYAINTVRKQYASSP